MAQSVLSLETLGDLDEGHAGPMINSAIAAAVADLDDRGADEKPRQIVITIGICKASDGNYAISQVKAAVKLPPYSTGKTVSKIERKNGKSSLAFDAYSADNPDQAHFEVLDKKAE